MNTVILIEPKWPHRGLAWRGAQYCDAPRRCVAFSQALDARQGLAERFTLASHVAAGAMERSEPQNLSGAPESKPEKSNRLN